MRLIDADKIIDSLGISDMDFAIGAVIDEQPTVFDVDKVVEQLETRKTRAAALQKKYASEHKYASVYFEGETDAFEFAIKIVKDGGVE
uniref:Uncharacterized protein n=1 Tax=virus sp. ctEfN2 TaxID=2825810 RepID=A0A8S5RMU0_9VIRU|nr:MAG TPA: hypothetical protein [virus sp. ctEfN2]